MRLPGRCTRCRKFRYVTVNSSSLAMVAAGGYVAEGICAKCEKDEENSNKGVTKHDRR